MKAVLCCLILFVSILPVSVSALATETFGDGQIQTSSDWPDGTKNLVRSSGKVYSLWVNGNENFYYKGNCDAFNDFLDKYVAVDIPVHRIVLVESGYTKSLSGKRSINFDWSLNVKSGIAKAHIIKEKGEKAPQSFPYIQLPVTDGYFLKQIIFPENVELDISPDVKEHYNISLIEDVYKWSGPVRKWKEFADPYVQSLRDCEHNPDLGYMQITSPLIEKYFPGYKIYAIDTVFVSKSCVYALNIKGDIIDLGDDDWSSPDGTVTPFRNPKMSNFFKEQKIKISDSDTATDIAKLIEEISFSCHAVRSFKRTTCNMKVLNKHHIIKSMTYKDKNYSYIAERKDKFWKITKKYVGPPACTIEQPNWELIVDSNDILIEVQH